MSDVRSLDTIVNGEVGRGCRLCLLAVWPVRGAWSNMDG